MKEGFTEAVVTKRDTDGLTVLHHAAVGGKIPIARFLVEEGNLDVNSKHLAILKGHFHLVIYLLYYGADLNATTKKGAYSFALCRRKWKLNDLHVCKSLKLV